MTKLALNQLELQVETLLESLEQLQAENVLLRQKIAVHIQENARLQHKNVRAIMQVKQVIKQMKEELV